MVDGPQPQLEQELLEHFRDAQTAAEVKQTLRGKLLDLEAMAATGSRALPGDGNLRFRNPALHAENTLWMWALAICVMCSSWSSLGWWSLCAGLLSLMIAPILGSLHDECVRPVSLFLCVTLMSTFLVGATAYGPFAEEVYDRLATFHTSLTIAAGIAATLVAYTAWLTLVNSGGGITALLAVLCVVTLVQWRIKGVWAALACAVASFAAAAATVRGIQRFVVFARGEAWVDGGSLNRFEEVGAESPGRALVRKRPRGTVCLTRQGHGATARAPGPPAPSRRAVERRTHAPHSTSLWSVAL